MIFFVFRDVIEGWRFEFSHWLSYILSSYPEYYRALFLSCRVMRVGPYFVEYAFTLSNPYMALFRTFT